MCKLITPSNYVQSLDQVRKGQCGDIMPEENIEVVPSEEDGNVPAEAPSEQPKVDSPADGETPKVDEPAQPAEPEAELFDLPDGRKVDAATLAKEFKENFLPEFTRKSQTLAELEKSNLPTNKTPDNPLADPNYAPQTYAELAAQIETQTLAKIEAKEQAKVEQQKVIEDAVVAQLEEVKKIDPGLNENALFLHANKYGFRDLKAAHQNMKDMSEMAKKVATTTATNIAKRNDPVSVSPGATGSRPDPSGFGNAVEYLRSLK